MNIQDILAQQREYFRSGATLPIEKRIIWLKKLYEEIKQREEEIYSALKADLGKSDFEAYMCEVGMTLSEISHLIKNVKKYASPRKVKTPMSQYPSKGYIFTEPYGNTLIMSPWNYPFLLTMQPLATAIAAGNTAVVKPSAYSSATSETVKKITVACFDTSLAAVVTGGREQNKLLLDQKFDFIFFTGSQGVGKEVLRRAAEHLTPSVLELGGKSPCIVDKTAKIPLAAKRIVFGKYLNCGQTCVAPDYVLCHQSVKEEFTKAVISEIKAQLGEDYKANSDYGKIINKKHFDRICGLIDRKKTVFGGEWDEQALKIAPTVMTEVTESDAVMGEEIFGPVLPILTYTDTKEILDFVCARPKPLALYVFAEDKDFISTVTRRIPYGGGCINDTVIHLTADTLPFGGVGESGMGAYHGETGFNTFSHKKGVLDKKTWLDLSMRYQPYDREKSAKIIRKFLK